jgi:hypothetical protein
MKKTYMKPQTVTMEMENECNLLADSSIVTLTIDNNKTFASDEAVGAKTNGGVDLWADDEDE